MMQLGRDIWFDAVDARPLKSARYFEPIAMLLVMLAFSLGIGIDIGVRLVKK